MVMEYISKGELSDLIDKRGGLNESEARFYIQQILSGIEYCHKNKVSHRDIKLENLLLDDNMNIKIVDFGLSNIMQPGSFLKTLCGSPNYAAPEVISGIKYSGSEVDVWSTGVVLYTILTGYLPFDDTSTCALFNKIRTAKYILPNYLSPEVKDLIQRMLNPDPIARITVEQIKAHPWYNVDIPPHLKWKEALLFLDLEALAQGMSFSANQAYKKIDDEVYNRVKSLETFSGASIDDEEYRKKIKDHSMDSFCVSYEILLDSKLKERRKAIKNSTIPMPFFVKQTKRTKKARPQASPNLKLVNKYEHPTNWVYGFRFPEGGAVLLNKLKTVLRTNGFEWKSENVFHLRVRTVHWNKEIVPLIIEKGKLKQVDYGRHLKFELHIHKSGSSYVMDVKLLEGQAIGFLGTCAKLYNSLEVELNRT